MKKLFLFGAVAAMCLTSCGNKDKADTTTEENNDAVTATDDAKDLMESVDTPDLDLGSAEVEEVEVEEDAAPVAEETSSSDNDIDELLSSYESYVTKYVSIAKKAKAGDMSALTEYASLAEEAQDLNEKLNNVKSQMTSSQAAKFAKIAQKAATAAM